MRQKRQALDVLLAHGEQRRLGMVPFTWLCVALLLASLPLASPARDDPVLYHLTLVFALAVPFCYAWDSRLLERAHRRRFLESVLLTSMTPAEWSDGLVWRAAAAASVAAVPVWLLDMGMSTPEGVLQAALWLPAVAALTATMAYGHQLRFALAGSLIAQTALAPCVLSGLLLVLSLAQADSSDTLWTIGISAALLLTARFQVLATFESTEESQLKDASPHEAKLTRRIRNPIVRREWYRSLHRGGIWRRIALLAAVILGLGWLDTTPAPYVGTLFDNTGPLQAQLLHGLQPDHLLLLLCILAMLGLWKTFGESLAGGIRDRRALELTGLTADDYLEGWRGWVLRCRTRESIAVVLVGLTCSCEGSAESNRFLVLSVIGLAITYIVILNGMVSIGLLAVFAWFALVWCRVLSYTDELSFLALVGLVASIAFSRRARKVALRALGAPDGALVLPTHP